MTKAMEGFLKRYPQATIQKIFDPRNKMTTYIFNDDTNGFFDKQSVSGKDMSKYDEEKVEEFYTSKIERRFYR